VPRGVWPLVGLVLLLGSGEAFAWTAGEREDPLAEARLRIGRGDAAGAVEILQRFVAANPEDSDGYLLLGTALALVPKRSEALEALRRAVDLAPQSAQAHHTLAMALARFGELDQARLAFERTLKLDPELAAAHGSLAAILAAQGELEAAAQQFTEALRRERDKKVAARYHYLRGRVYRQENRSRQAVKDFERAVELNPGLARAYLELGLARVELQDHQGALEALRRAAELAPEDPDAQYELGLQYLRMGQPHQSLDPLKAASRLRPDHRGVLLALARALRAVGRAEEARPVLERIRQAAKAEAFHDPNEAKAGELNNAGVRLEKEGRLAAALEKYRAAVALNPREVSFRRNLALVLCRLERWPEAVAELQEVLRARPGDVDATRAFYIALEKIDETR
jgi:protein O-GlcNAc transferase